MSSQVSPKARSWACFYFFHSSVTSWSQHHQTQHFLQMMHSSIVNSEDARLLQQDCDAQQQWESRWQIKSHREKCQAIWISTNKRYQRETTYKMHGHILQAVDSAKYLGVTISYSDDMQRRTHTESVTAKASRTVGFLRQNLYSCTKEVCEATYCALVRPTLE